MRHAAESELLPVTFLWREQGPVATQRAWSQCYWLMHDAMLARGYDVVYREYPGGDDWFIWGEELGTALIHLLE